MLKHCLLTMALAGLIGAGSCSAIAQNSGSSDQPPAQAGEPPEHGQGHRHFDPQQRADRLTKELKLTSDQQPKVLDVLKSEQSQMEALRSDTSLSNEDRHAKMMDIHKTSNDQIRALLDAKQQKKWDTMQSRRDQWMHGHNHEGQGSDTPPPPQQ